MKLIPTSDEKRQTNFNDLRHASKITFKIHHHYNKQDYYYKMNTHTSF